MEKSLVSILIPVYNREKYIQDTLESCYNQDYKNFEIIIYDDGSTDKTIEKILRFKKTSKHHKKNKLKVIQNSVNYGVGYARNILLNNFKGKYACWLDSDDMMASNRISKNIKVLEENKYDIIYSQVVTFRYKKDNMTNGKIITADVTKYDKKEWTSLKHNTTCATAFFSEIVKEFKFVGDLKYGAEDVLWLWRLLQHNIKVGFVKKPLYYYRQHSQRIGVQKRDSRNVDKKLAEDKIIGDFIKKIQNEGK